MFRRSLLFAAALAAASATAMATPPGACPFLVALAGYERVPFDRQGELATDDATAEAALDRLRHWDVGLLFALRALPQTFLGYRATVDQVKAVFVPHYATVECPFPALCRFHFPAGGWFQVQGNRDGSVAGVSFQLVNQPDEGAAMVRFVRALAESDALSLFFRENRYVAAERAVRERQRRRVAPVRVPAIPVNQAASTDADVLLIPENHRQRGAADLALTLVEAGSVDWVALETFSHTMQDALDRCEDATLLPFLEEVARRWQGCEAHRSSEYRIVRAARRRGLPVYGIDAEVAYRARWMLAREHFDSSYWIGDDALLLGTRNALWAEHVPAVGRGIVVGGEGHFTFHPGLNFQDFHAVRHPRRRMVIVDPLELEKSPLYIPCDREREPPPERRTRGRLESILR